MPPPDGRLPKPVPPPRLLARLPPCRPICCRALAWRLASESPRVVPPNLSAVARSRYGAPPRCSGLCCQRFPPAPDGRVETRLPPARLPRFPPPAIGFDGRAPPTFPRFPPPMLVRLPPPMLELRLKLLFLLMVISL